MQFEHKIRLYFNEKKFYLPSTVTLMS